MFDMFINYQTKIGPLFWMGYVISTCFFPLTFVFSNTLLAKICNSKTRGTMFAFSGVMGSIAIAVLNAISAEIFKDNNKIVFEIAFGNYVLLSIIIVILALKGKLN